jgi:phospholipid/cholesterol/gamma-HCH transport system substrate-binding protein
MKKMSTEIKVGVFVVLGILVLAYMTVNIEKIGIGRAVGYRIYAKLDSAAGLVKNSPVRIAGVEVGRVESIVLETGKAKVTLHLPFQITLPIDSMVFVKSEGLLGEKYIEIQPGSSKDVFARQNAEVRQGASPADMDQIFTQMNSVATDIKGVTASLNRVLGGGEGEQTLRKTFENIKEITTDLNITVKQNREKFSTIMSNFENLSGDLAGVSTKAGNAFNTINKVAKKIDDGEGTLGKLVADKTLYVEAKDAMANLNKIVKKIDDGEGTLGKLVADKTLYDQSKGAMTSLNNIAKKIEKGEGTLGKLTTDETLYTETKSAIKKIGKAGEGLQEQTPITVLGTVLGFLF